MHFDVVLSEFIHPCSKKRRRAQFSIRAELTWLSVCVRFRCVCVCVLQMCVCVHAFQMCVSVCVRFRCVCARASGVCVCVRFRCVCVHARASVHGKLLTQRATVTPTIPSVFNARLVPSDSPYIES